MRFICTLVLAGAVALVTPAQQFGPQQTVTSSASGVRLGDAADIDQDGDLDLVFAAYFGGSVYWYENIDAQGSFGGQQLIASGIPGVNSVVAGDIDGDGDTDVVTAAYFDDSVNWYSNTDGQGGFGPALPLTSAANGAFSVHSADIDSDGDLDVLHTAIFDDEVALFFNADGRGMFGSKQVIASGADQAIYVSTADLDVDSDLDVLSAWFGDNTAAWHENLDGLGSVGPPQLVSTSSMGIYSVAASDLNQDNAPDILVASANDNTVSWFENLDGLGNFGLVQTITTSADGVNVAQAADFDGDGDQDVLSASTLDSSIAWYENADGVGTFGSKQVITSSAPIARHAFPADLDGDGFQDVVWSSQQDDTVAWHKNNAFPTALVPYGCGVNPSDSLQPLSGTPTIGTSLVLGVDNPLGTQAPGSLPFVGVSALPDAAFPCGTLLPGFGMAGGGAAGELLLNTAPPNLVQPLFFNGLWAGPGFPAPVLLLIPSDPALVGASFYAQGLMVDLAPGTSAPFALTEALHLVLGS